MRLQYGAVAAFISYSLVLFKPYEFKKCRFYGCFTKSDITLVSFWYEKGDICMNAVKFLGVQPILFYSRLYVSILLILLVYILYNNKGLFYYKNLEEKIAGFSLYFSQLQFDIFENNYHQFSFLYWHGEIRCYNIVKSFEII